MHIGNRRIINLLRSVDPRLGPEALQRQMENLKNAADDQINADILFLGRSPSYSPPLTTSGIGSRMEEFINTPLCTLAQWGQFRAGSPKAIKASLQLLIEQETKFESIKSTPLIW